LQLSDFCVCILPVVLASMLLTFFCGGSITWVELAPLMSIEHIGEEWRKGPATSHPLTMPQGQLGDVVWERWEQGP